MCSILNPTSVIGKFFAPGCAHPQSQAGLSQPNNSKGPGSFVGKKKSLNLTQLPKVAENWNSSNSCLRFEVLCLSKLETFG